MRSVLVIVALVACSCVVFGDDKQKAKSKAAAAINLAKARAEAEAKPAVKGADSPHTDLAKAKAEAAKDGKPLVVWVGEPAPAATLKAVDAVHVLLKSFPDVPKARAVVFRCRDGECSQKSSVESTPSVELLKDMIRSAGSSHAETGEPETFYIDTAMDAADAPAPPVTRYEKRTFQECYVDELGRQRCRTVERLVPVAAENPAALEVLTSPPPAPEAATDQPASAGRSRRVWFPRVSEFASTVIENRPRLFDGRVVNAIAARCRR